MKISIVKESDTVDCRTLSPIPFKGDIEVRPLIRDLEAFTGDRIDFETYKERYISHLRLSYMSYPRWWENLLRCDEIAILTSGAESSLVEIPHAFILKEIIETLSSQ